MNFLRKHTPTSTITFPSLFTTSTGSTDDYDHDHVIDCNNHGSDSYSKSEEIDLTNPKMAYQKFQQRVTRYIHNAYWYVCPDRTYIHNQHSVSHASSYTNTRSSHIGRLVVNKFKSVENTSNIYRNRIDGTVSTSLVEDIMSLVNAMAHALHTYLSEHGTGETKNNPTTTMMTIDETIQMFMSGIRHILYTLEQNQLRRSSTNMFFYYSSMARSNVVEQICATMNDYIRLSESIETFMSGSIPKMIHQLQRRPAKDAHHYPSGSIRLDTVEQSEVYATLQKNTDDLILLYSNDAVMLSGQISLYMIRQMKISSSIAIDFFTFSWENEWTNNELCRNMIDLHIHKILLQCEQYTVGNKNIRNKNVDESNEHYCPDDRYNTKIYLFHKIVVSVVRATICFYIRCLIQNKADPIALHRGTTTKDRSNNTYYFYDPQRALYRMYDDIRIMEKYFIRQYCHINDTHATLLRRIIMDEFSTLELLYECLLCCCNEHIESDSTPAAVTSALESFIVVIHKRCTNGNALITRYLIGDLYVLMSPSISSTTTTPPRFRFVPLHRNNNYYYNSKKMYHQRVTSIQNTLQKLQPDLTLLTSRMDEMRGQLGFEDRPKIKHINSSSEANVISSFHQLNTMLQGLYEERITHGILPVLCNLLCLPHFDSNDYDDNHDYNDDTISPTEIIVELFVHPIRTINRTLHR